MTVFNHYMAIMVLNNPQRTQQSSVFKILERMTAEERCEYIKTVFTERFKTEDEAMDFMSQYNYGRYRKKSEPERYALNNKYLGSVIFVLWRNKRCSYTQK